MTLKGLSSVVPLVFFFGKIWQVYIKLRTDMKYDLEGKRCFNVQDYQKN